MTTHEFEPELKEPTPRRVSYRDGFGAGCGSWFGRLFVVPHTIIGIGALCVAIWDTGVYVAIGLFGTDFDGKIVKKVESRTSKGHMYYYTHYTFTVDGQPYTGEVSVSEERYPETKVGDAITVRALESSPRTGNWPEIPGHRPIRDLGGIWFFALGWNGLMSIVLWHLYVRPWRQRSLVRWGQPTEGIIRSTSKEVNKGTTAYRVEYEFVAPTLDGSEGRVIAGKMTSTTKDAANAHVGQLVTVVYYPDKPWRNLLYAYSDYRAAN